MAKVYVIDAFPALGAFSMVAMKMGYHLLKVLDDEQRTLELFQENVHCTDDKMSILTYDDDRCIRETYRTIRKMRNDDDNDVHIHLHASPYLDKKMQGCRLQILQRMLDEWKPDSWDFVFNKSPKDSQLCQNMLSFDTAICGVPQSKRLYVCGRNFELNTQKVIHLFPDDVLSIDSNRYMLRLPTPLSNSSRSSSYCRPLSVPAYTVSPRSLKVYDKELDCIIRTLTPCECLQLQGFYEYPLLAIPSLTTRAYTAISYSIPPPVCECIIRGIRVRLT